MGGLGDLFDPGTPPKREIAQFDPTTQELLKKNEQGAFQDAGFRDAEIDKNLGYGNQMYGLLNSGMGDAIKNKYASKLNSDVTQMRDVERLNFRSNQIQRLRKAQHAVAVKKSLETDAFAAEMQANTAREAARAQAIGSMMQMVGGMGGMMMGGGGGGGGGGGMSPNYGGSGMGAGRSTMVDYNGGAGQGAGYGTASMNSAGRNRSSSYLDSIQGIGSSGNMEA